MEIALYALIGVLSVVAGSLSAAAVRRISQRHDHGPWRVRGQEYHPPQGGVDISGRGPTTMQLIQDMTYGWTIITEQCADEDCLLIRTRKVTGRAAGA